jgi:hypothetical protein
MSFIRSKTDVAQILNQLVDPMPGKRAHWSSGSAEKHTSGNPTYRELYRLTVLLKFELAVVCAEVTHCFSSTS